jgi:para-aminobenzoate synthetase component 1
MEFYAENAIIDPLDKFLKLNEISQPPFAVFFKIIANFACHRAVLEKRRTSYFTTYKRNFQTIFGSIKDEESKNKLASDPKERSENIMITDLVRNDLSQRAKKDLYRTVFILYASTSNDFYGYL